MNFEPAPTYEALYDFESQIEQCFAAIAEARSNVPAFAQRGETTLPDTRIEFAFTTDEAIQSYSIANDGFRYPSSFKGLLRASVISKRRKDFTLTEHRRLVAAVRACIYQFETLITRDNLPYLNLLLALESGSEQELDEQKEQDLTSIQFSIHFHIRPDAWPPV